MIIRNHPTLFLSTAVCASSLVLCVATRASAEPVPAPLAVPQGMLAQVPSPPPAPSAGRDLQPIDLTPVNLPERGGAFTTLQNLRTGTLYYLPAKMFMNVNVENSLRLETNVYQTQHHNIAGGVYRVIPDVTLGYAFNKQARIAANYFMFQDTYFNQGANLTRNVQSVGLSSQRDFYINPATVVTTGLMGRELFIQKSPNLTDVLPSVSMVRRVGTYGAVYSSVLGQLRWQSFQHWQEFDQFYSVGAVYRKPKYALIADTTLVDNFGRGSLRGGPNSNHLIVVTLEANRRLSSTVPLLAFIRAQPIFNMGQESRQGFAGFNLRLFGGLRLELSKPAIFPVKLKST